jgi:hypothetical protein
MFLCVCFFFCSFGFLTDFVVGTQLLSPLAIFQVFCAVLWLLDEYWSYTLFTLASVVMYEATTVFQRTRTQQMLGGMSPKPSPIYVYRAHKWQMVTTKDLLPGDLISLAFKKRSSATRPVVPPATQPHGVPTATATATGATATGTCVTVFVVSDAITFMCALLDCCLVFPVTVGFWTKQHRKIKELPRQPKTKSFLATVSWCVALQLLTKHP